MKKVDFLIVTPPQAPIGKQIYETLKKLNFKVINFNERPNFFYQQIGLRLPVLREKIINRINQKFYRKVKKISPSYLVVMKGKNLKKETIESIGKLGVKTINIFPEYISHWKSMNYFAPVYDYFLVPCYYVLNYAKKQGFNNFYYLTFAADLPKDSPYPVIDKYLYDVTFIGSVNNDYYPERVEFLSALTDFDLHIWGNKGWLDTPLKKFYHSRPADEEMFDIYRHSKIVVNIDYHAQPIDGVNIRPFEVTACGSLLVNDAVSPDIFRLFKENEEFVPFKDENDLPNKVKYYLEHEDGRLKVAKAGFERTRREHTWDDRIKQLLNIIGI